MIPPVAPAELAEMTVHQRLSAVMAAWPYIEKGRKNTDKNYSYASAADYESELHGYLVAYGLVRTMTMRDFVATDTIVSATYTFALTCTDRPGDCIVSDVSMACQHYKGGLAPAVGSMQSYATKNWTRSMFAIPDFGEKDVDAYEARVEQAEQAVAAASQLDAILAAIAAATDGAGLKAVAAGGASLPVEQQATVRSAWAARKAELAAASGAK